MPSRVNPILWGLFIILFVFAVVRADDHSSVKPEANRAESAIKSLQSPPIIYDSGPVESVVAFNAAKPVNMWRTQAAINVSSPGLVECVLIPDLNQAVAAEGGPVENQLDLCLLGPDGNPRSFELFWREKGRQETVVLENTNVWLVDKQLMWDGVVPENFIVNKLIVDMADKDYVGQVSVAAMVDDTKWFFLVKDAALYKNGSAKQADIAIEEGVYKRLRLSFKGYDKKYEETPLFVERVQAVGMRSGRDYEKTSFQPDYNETTKDETTVVRMALPGSGLWVGDIKIRTGALFQGTWQLGREKTVLGKREFKEIRTGKVSYVGENKQTLLIKADLWWPDQTLVVRMTSGEFFGGVQAVDIQARIPRMAFFADSAGRYTVQAGCGNTTKILNLAGDRDRKIDHVPVFSDINDNPRYHPDNLIEKYNITGGPFNQENYTWKADVRVNGPGFWRLTLNERVCLEENIAALRVVEDGNQIPYFFGPEEERLIPLEAVREYDADHNRTVYTIRLPFVSPQWSAIRLNAEGFFERQLVFQKHIPGMIGWQPWKTRSWVGPKDGEADFRLNLADFPKDQNEIRLIVDHGDNQPLDLNAISAVYSARDLFFLASAPGTYKLFGGNPEALRVSYKDFEMIKDDLLAAVPKQVVMGKIETILPARGTGLTGKEVGGGPFDDSGYTWSSPLKEITQPGFYQLRLNQQVSLEDNRQGLRLVSGNQQVPFFMGEPYHRRVELAAEEKYDRKKNETVWLVSLPQPSVHWRQLRLTAEGVFSRTVVFECRKPGNTGWQPWRRVEWKNRHSGEAALESPLPGFPSEQQDIRVVMRHGDNKPLEIKKIEAVYSTQDVFFIAAQSDGYRLVGGNPKASAPSYDLALIRDYVLKNEPKKIAMGEIDTLKPTGWKTKIGHSFSEQGWGLYAVLGLVTLILLIVIVRLFPKEQD